VLVGKIALVASATALALLLLAGSAYVSAIVTAALWLFGRLR
jgi:hypothetical protein